MCKLPHAPNIKSTRMVCKAMNVDELRKILEPLDGDLLVVLASDGEGNSYKLCIAENVEDYVFDRLNRDIYEASEYEGERCVVLWPQ